MLNDITINKVTKTQFTYHRQLGLPLHCDGARIFHAMVSFCLPPDSGLLKTYINLKSGWSVILYNTVAEPGCRNIWWNVFMPRNILACPWQSCWSSVTQPPSVFQRCIFKHWVVADVFQILGSAVHWVRTAHCALSHSAQCMCWSSLVAVDIKEHDMWCKSKLHNIREIYNSQLCNNCMQYIHWL